jgi:SAM-dependent methyltransferase
MGAEPSRGLAAASPQARAWSAFWQEQGRDSRCLADALPETRGLLNAHWSAFAVGLPAGARVLDIGCGGGVVGRALLAARPDLDIVGIDVAIVPPCGEPRLKLHGSTRMEQLPFVEGAFDAAVSQFGLEYGHVEEAGAEVARVLVPGAPVSFLVHHAQGAIAGQSRARQRALRGLTSAGVKRAFLSGRGAALERELQALQTDPAADAIVAPVGQALRRQLCRNGAGREAIWRAVAEALGPEGVLLDALDRCCVTTDALPAWLKSLTHSLEIESASPLRRRNGEPIAWRIDGAKPAPSRESAAEPPV